MQDYNNYDNKNTIYGHNILNYKSLNYAKNLLAEAKKVRRGSSFWGFLLILEGIPMAILIIISGIIENNNIYLIIGIVTLLVSLSLGLWIMFYGSN